MLLVLATGTQDKVKEIKTILNAEISLDIKTLSDFPELLLPPETGKTYRENAILKAISVTKETGAVAIGDDSGLEVDALDGAPGLFSARFAGDGVSYAENRNKLLQLLSERPGEPRTARFVCTVAVTHPARPVEVVDGVCEGEISMSEEGSGGFGYDPIFFYPPLGKTFSLLTFTQKNKVSHRGRALHAALPILREMIAQTA